MKIDKIRSSSINTYRFCNWKYFLEYVLNCESLSGKAALQGTIIHQVMDWLALSKIKGIKEPEHKNLLERAWNYHIGKNPHIDIRRTTSRGDAADYKKCLNTIEKIKSSMYDPYKLNIIKSESKFNIPVPEFDDKILSGTIDLIHEIDNDTIEIVDWKSGKQKDFATMKDKDFYSLMKDVQPRVYHLAAFLLYPQYKNIMVTFYYVNEKDGATTLPFTVEDLPYTIAAIINFIKIVEGDKNIFRNRSWKCRTFCFYGRNNTCNTIWKDRHRYGMKYVEQKYVNLTVNQQKMLVGINDYKT
jgi:hypothetical protein